MKHTQKVCVCVALCVFSEGITSEDVQIIPVGKIYLSGDRK